MFDLFTSLWTERRTRAANRPIEDMDDRMLADIGVTREQVVRRLRHRRPSPV